MQSKAEIRRTPVNEPATWLPEELAADSDWRYTLTESDIAELDTATRGAVDRGLDVGAFGPDDFPLPHFGNTLSALVDMVENGRGVALIRGVPVDAYSKDELRTLYWGLGVHAGDVISQNSRGQLLAEVMDKGNDYGDRNTRGFATDAELQPHVDTSDMTMLLCVRTAKSGGESRVISSSSVYNCIVAEHPEYLDVLYRGFYNDLRGEGPTGDINELTHQPIPVYSFFADRLSCSFNSRMIENAIVKQGREMTADERRAFDFMRSVTLRDDLAHRFYLEKGDIEMISNHSLFHARDSFVDHADPDQKRCLYRFWINIRGGRPLAENFADRYNTGPRGGVAVGDGARYVF